MGGVPRNQSSAALERLFAPWGAKTGPPVKYAIALRRASSEPHTERIAAPALVAALSLVSIPAQKKRLQEGIRFQ